MAYRFTPSGIHKSIPPHSVVLSLTFILPFSLSLPASVSSSSLLRSFSLPFLLTSKKNLHLGAFWKRLTPLKFKREICTFSYACFRLFPPCLGGKGGYCTGTGGCEGRISPFSSSLPPGYKSTCVCVWGSKSNKFWAKNKYNKETKKTVISGSYGRLRSAGENIPSDNHSYVDEVIKQSSGAEMRHY